MASRTKSYTMKAFIVTLLLLCLSSFPNLASAQSPPPSYDDQLQGFDLIYQFGDSISDTGNLMRESNSSFCSFTPYGEALGKPTGRCSNGLLMVDYFAKAFNMPLLNPYLAKDADFSNGVNFAVAGATALDASRFPAAPTNSSLGVQLGWFRNHLESTCPSPSDCKHNFARALFLMGEVGGNDYNFAFLTGNSIQNVASLVPEVVQTISNAIKEVIGHGARLVVVPGNFPIGCIPAYLSRFGSNDTTMYDNLRCLRSLNEFAKLHNAHLQQAIKELQKQYPDVAIYYGDYYSAFTWVLRNAASLGFEKDGVFKPCCGDMAHPCGTGGVKACLEPSKRISWDGVHLTQDAYRNMAGWLLNNTFHHQTVSNAAEVSHGHVWFLINFLFKFYFFFLINI